ncbi:MAG TPA: hypothetical protein VFM66_10530, partial [Agromyces sp.]|nr:hypothetical protein [Agromyces sp.]
GGVDLPAGSTIVAVFVAGYGLVLLGWWIVDRRQGRATRVRGLETRPTPSGAPRPAGAGAPQPMNPVER